MAAKLITCTKQEQRSVIHFFWAESLPGAQIHIHMCDQYGDKVLCRRIVHEWIGMFENGRTGMTDAERSGRPATATTTRNEERTLELICENRRITGRNDTHIPPSCNFFNCYSSVFTNQFQGSFLFLVVVAVAGRPERSASVTILRPFSNISIHS